MHTSTGMDGTEDTLGGKVALITGANGGIGREVARQLALTGRYATIVLACRDRAKGLQAQHDLAAATGRPIFEVVAMDVADVDAVHAAVTALRALGRVDDLVMNAGGSGGPTPLALTKDGVTQIFASNVLGHVVLLDTLIAHGLLTHAAVFVSSEAARGIPKFGMRRPSLPTSSTEDFVSLCDGTYFRGRKSDPTLAYGQVKYVGAMWMAAAARQHPALRLVTMSLGNTRGTEVTRDLPPPLRLLMRHVLMPVVLPAFGLVHNVEDGARRLVDALTNRALESGHFYASKPDALTGPVVDQREIFPDLANAMYQDHADAAVHQFIRGPAR